MPMVVAGLAARWAFNDQYGLINDLIRRFVPNFHYDWFVCMEFSLKWCYCSWFMEGLTFLCNFGACRITVFIRYLWGSKNWWSRTGTSFFLNYTAKYNEDNTGASYFLYNVAIDKFWLSGMLWHQEVQGIQHLCWHIELCRRLLLIWILDMRLQ